MNNNQYINFEDILSDKPEDSDLVEVPVADNVFRAFLFFVTLVFAVVFVKFFLIHAVQGDALKQRAIANMTDSVVRPAPRGAILDSFGKPLLHNELSNKAFLLPRDLPEDPEERLTLVKKIGNIIGIAWEDLKKNIEEKNWGQSDRLLLSADITHNELVDLSSLNARGVYIEQGFKRVHEFPFAFSHVLGYTGLVNDEDIKNNDSLVVDDEIGRTGLEAYYDEYIRGINGIEIFFRNSIGRVEEKRSMSESVPGKTVKTSIDRDLQVFMYERLSAALKDLGKNIGVAIAMNPQNGEVLGMVNIPGFDSSKIADFLDAPFDPLFDRAIRGLYNPGSAIKPIVGIAALEEGVVTAETEIFSPGYIEIENPYDPSNPSRFLDWQPNGWVNIHSALAKSSNVFFYEVTGGFKNQAGIGIQKLKDWWSAFLLGSKTNIDLVGERIGFLPDPDWKKSKRNDEWRIGDTYNVAIGQGDLMVTPIALLNSIAAIANGGILYRPRIMTEILDENGDAVLRSSPEILSDIRDDIKDGVQDVREGMRDVALKSYGTAHSLSLLPFQVAAKTGTAQIQNNSKVNAFFVGYAPFEDPSIALIVLVEDAREGSLNTIPVAKDIFLWYYENRLKH